MELLFESRLEIAGAEGKLKFVQARPEVLPDEVIVPSGFADGAGCSIYGTVLRDGGRYRMWYQGWPKDWDGGNSALVACAESDDGLDWKKPDLDLVEFGPGANNLCDLGFHSPSVFIDPDAPSSHRYRAAGHSAPYYVGAHPQVTRAGYYTAHSADGLHWELDSTEPTWDGADVITSIYHPAQRRGIVTLKHSPRVRGIPRRSVYEAELRDGQWSRERAALIPDDFDDVAAVARGYASADYYGMGMMPAGSGTVGFLAQFRHTLPRTAGSEVGVFGHMDMSLAYQCRPGDRWLHASGRADFLTHGVRPWAAGGVYPSSCPLEVGDEHRLYINGSRRSHAWYVDDRWQIIEERKKQLIEGGLGGIGLARFPRWRLFGFHADPAGVLTLDLGDVAEESELLLNFETERGGSLRVELADTTGRSQEDAVPLEGDALAQPAAWKDGTTVAPGAGGPVRARIHMDRAKVWAWELRPKKD